MTPEQAIRQIAEGFEALGFWTDCGDKRADIYVDTDLLMVYAPDLDKVARIEFCFRPPRVEHGFRAARTPEEAAAELTASSAHPDPDPAAPA